MPLHLGAVKGLRSVQVLMAGTCHCTWGCASRVAGSALKADSGRKGNHFASVGMSRTKLNEPEKVTFRQEDFLAVGEACKATF